MASTLYSVSATVRLLLPLSIGASRSQVGASLPGIDNQWLFAEFSPDGTRVYGAYDTGTAFVWDVDPERWADHACEVAGRDLSEEEWQRFLPDRPYGDVCP